LPPADAARYELSYPASFQVGRVRERGPRPLKIV